MYERAIRSAIATQKTKNTILWWHGVCPEISIPGLKIQQYVPITDTTFGLQNRDSNSRPDLSEEHWTRVVTKDVMFWELAVREGGLFLDLDTTSVADVSFLLENYDMVSPLDVGWDPANPTYGWRNVAILMMRRQSDVANQCLRRLQDILSKPNMQYFELGPKLLTHVLNERGFDNVFTPPHRMLGGFTGGVEASQYLNWKFELAENTRILHWFSSSKEMRMFDPDNITTRTLRFENRKQMPETVLIPNNYRYGVEIGVQRGEFSGHLLERWTGQMALIDSWKTFPKEEYNDGSNVSELENLRNLAATVEMTQRFPGRCEIVRSLSTEAGNKYPNNYFDFVYLDANHRYERVLEDLRIWVPKIRSGGMLCGHDYLDGELPQGSFGVKKAVNEFFGRPPDIVTKEYWASYFYFV